MYAFILSLAAHNLPVNGTVFLPGIDKQSSECTVSSVYHLALKQPIHLLFASKEDDTFLEFVKVALVNSESKASQKVAVERNENE